MVERALAEPTPDAAGKLLGCPKELGPRVYRALQALRLPLGRPLRSEEGSNDP
jgi:hypothetical protein